MPPLFRIARGALVVAALAGALGCSAPAPDPATVEALFAEARAHDAEGRHDDAIAVYRRLLAEDANSFEGHYWIGRAMNLAGQYPEAREHFARAIELSARSNRDQTLRMMAIAWVFVSDASQAAGYYRQVFDARMAAGNPAGASEVANELGRMYLELGQEESAREWYRRGFDVAAEQTGRTEVEVDMAAMRWAHAQARIAARRGQADTAAEHVASVQAIVERGTNTGQEAQLAYLRGYVALHLGDAAGAVSALEGADHGDPFILLLLAQAHERTGDTAAASDYYGRVLASTSHALTAAIARPIAREWLEKARGGGGA